MECGFFDHRTVFHELVTRRVPPPDKDKGRPLLLKNFLLEEDFN